MKTYFTASALALAMLVVPVAAFDEDKHQAPQVTNEISATVNNASNEARQRYQKPGAAIRLLEPQLIRMDEHSEQRVTIKFAPPKKGELYLSARPKKGITIDGSTSQWHFDLANETAVIEIDLSSQSRGQYHIMFNAKVTEHGLTSSRVFGLPVYVGEQTSKTKPKNTTQNGVVIMQAEETVY
ncbi:MAG: hypothetical protein ACI9Y1_001117 [Lentisphaeria bacterium]|jgi:hypothetical protein